MAEEGKTSTTDRVLTALLVVPLLMVSNGFVIYKLWGWFAVPTLHAPAISWGNAMGLDLLVSMFIINTSSPYRAMSWFERLVLGLLIGGVTLGYAAIVHAVVG